MEIKKKPLISKFIIILLVAMVLVTFIIMVIGTFYYKKIDVSENITNNQGSSGKNIEIKINYSHLNDIEGPECEALLNQNEIEDIRNNDEKRFINDKCVTKIKEKMLDSPFVLTEISNMKEARANPHTILLDDGRVLIVGGNAGKDKSAEIYNPETNQFKMITKNVYQYIPEGFRCKFFNEELFRLPNDKIFYLGTIFDPKTDTFYLPKDNYALDLIKYENNISLKTNHNKNQIIKIFNDGKVLWSKGCKSKIQNNPATYYGCTEVSLEDPFDTDKFVTGKLNIDRARFEGIKTQNYYLLNENKKIIELPDNNILIHGGLKLDANNNIIMPEKDELYDPLSGKVKIIDQESEILESLLIDNQPYLFKTIWKLEYIPITKYQVFNDETKLFIDNIKMSNEPGSRYNFKKSYLIQIFQEMAIVLDLKNKKIFRLPNPNLYGYNQSVTSLKNDDLLILGGYVDDSPTGSFEERSKFAAIVTDKQLIKK